MSDEQIEQAKMLLMSKTEYVLWEELDKLRHVTGLGHELKVVWSPISSSKLSGEVKNDVIYVYEEDCTRALNVLRHEFFDYSVSRAIKPYERATAFYRAMVNALIEKLGEEAYSEKEKVVEALKRIFSQSPV